MFPLKSCVILSSFGVGLCNFNFVAFGDWGYNSSALLETMAAVNAVSSARDFVLLLGDNAYPEGFSSADDPQFSVFTDIVAAGTSIPHYVVLGNHDYLGNVAAQIEYSAVDSRWNLPTNYYKEVLFKDGVRLCMLFVDTNQFDSSQAAWLNGQLRGADCDTSTGWTIVSGHHPIWSAGMYSDSYELKQELLPLLREYNVTLYLCGHEHLHEIFYDGKVTQVVSGAAAMPRRPIRFGTHNLQIWGSSGFDKAGFMRLLVSSDSVEVHFVSSATREDLVSFTMTRDATSDSMFGHIEWLNVDAGKGVDRIRSLSSAAILIISLLAI
jgi:3',5'-cyclic AMP phosphodiesterase CpdA